MCSPVSSSVSLLRLFDMMCRPQWFKLWSVFCMYAQYTTDSFFIVLLLERPYLPPKFAPKTRFAEYLTNSVANRWPMKLINTSLADDLSQRNLQNRRTNQRQRFLILKYSLGGIPQASSVTRNHTQDKPVNIHVSSYLNYLPKSRLTSQKQNFPCTIPQSKKDGELRQVSNEKQLWRHLRYFSWQCQ